MTRTIATNAKTAIACALASALTLGAACVPALAVSNLPNQPVVSTKSCDRISEATAIACAQDYLGLSPKDIEEVDVDMESYNGHLCFEVEFDTWASDLDYHVMVDACNGTIRGSWTE